MEIEKPPTPWFRKTRYLILLAFIVLLLGLSLASFVIPSPPKTKNQVALDRTITYFVDSYNFTTGLIPETKGGSTYWLYSDNYLAALALSRYDPSNTSTVNFGLALNEALGSYAASLPASFRQNQYTALNSTVSSFNCSDNVTLGWSAHGGGPPLQGPETIRTSTNDGNPSCSTQNYADLMLLQAVFQHRLGSSAQALTFFQSASSDFDGKGFADAAFSGVYQTYKLALYVYASSCLGQFSTDKNFVPIVDLMLGQQDNSTGGFYTGYNTSLQHSGTTVNTETTALASLALEQVIHPSARC